MARERMSCFIKDEPVQVFAMASFFKFSDLAKLASQKALGVPLDDWGMDDRVLMGKSALSKLEELQKMRMEGLRGILGRSNSMEVDQHSQSCFKRGMVEELWRGKVREVGIGLKPDSDLFELLAIDLRGDHCGDCLVMLGMTIQKCLYAATELPKSV